MVNIRWSASFAYTIGLIATDGCLSSDGRHIDLTSKDLDQLKNFIKILRLKYKIGLKSRSAKGERKYYRVQFGDVKFYKFLLKVGLTPNKSTTIGVLRIPDKFFADFLRGALDGDGYTYSYWDPRWRSSFRLYLGFTSASLKHLEWINETIKRLYCIEGRIKKNKNCFYLVYAKTNSVVLANFLYHSNKVICLERKRFKIKQALSIISQQAGVAKLVYALP